MKLSKLEQETIITFNEAEDFAEVYTHNGRLRKRLAELAAARADDVQYRGADHGSVSYRVPKKWIKVNPTYKLEMSEERKQELSERMKSIRVSQLKHSISSVDKK